MNWHRVTISEWERRYQRDLYAASQLPRGQYIDFLRCCPAGLNSTSQPCSSGLDTKASSNAQSPRADY